MHFIHTRANTQKRSHVYFLRKRLGGPDIKQRNVENPLNMLVLFFRKERLLALF